MTIRPTSAGTKRMAVALAATALAGLFVGAWAVKACSGRPGPGQPCLRGTTFVRGFEDPADPLHVMAARGDGQAFAEIARHPTLDRGIAMSRDEAAFRASRPLWSWLAWLVSLGHPRWVLLAMLVLTLF